MGVAMKLSGLLLARPLERSSRLAQGSLAESLQRLSAGLRIVHAADDAAGAAVAVNLETEAMSQRAALRNIESAWGYLDVTETALSTQVELLQRGRSLAVAAASEVLDSESRSYLDDEYQELLVEADRLVAATEYQDMGVLAGASSRVSIGLVIDTSASMGTFLAQLQAAFPDFTSALSDYDVESGVAEAHVQSDSGDNVRLRSQMAPGSSSGALAALSIQSGRIDTYTALTETAGTTALTGVHEDDAFTPSAASTRKILFMVTDATRELVFGDPTKTEADVATELAAAGWEVHMVARNSHSTVYDDIVTATGGTFHSLSAGVGAALDTLEADLTDTVTRNRALSVQVGTGNDPEDVFETGLPVQTDLSTLGLSGSSIATHTDALDALDALDAALKTVQRGLGTVGAAGRRLEYQQSIAEAAQLAAMQSKSGIEDADMALETSDLASAQLQANVANAALVQARNMARMSLQALLGDAG